MPRSSYLMVVIVAALMAPAMASAQTPTSGLAISGTPRERIVSDDPVVNVALDVALTVQNIVCSDRVSLPVALTVLARVEGSGNGTLPTNATITTLVSPSSLTFSVPAGAYGSSSAVGVGSPYRDSKTVTVLATADRLNNTSVVKFSIEARLAAFSGDACRTQTIPAAVQATEFRATFNATGTDPTPTPPRMPVPAAWAAVALGIVALIVGRRRPA